jgi:hypothetical protein
MNENKLSEQELFELYIILGYSPMQKQTNIESINTQASDHVVCMIKERLLKIKKLEENSNTTNEQIIKMIRGQLSIILALPINNS